MDLNQLYFDHQVLLMKAGNAASPGDRCDLRMGASHLAGRIGDIQRALGAGAAPAWEGLAATRASLPAAPAQSGRGLAR